MSFLGAIGLGGHSPVGSEYSASPGSHGAPSPSNNDVGPPAGARIDLALDMDVQGTDGAIDDDAASPAAAQYDAGADYSCEYMYPDDGTEDEEQDNEIIADDIERAMNGDIVDDDVLNQVLKDADAKKTAGERRREEARRKEQEEYENLTSAAACQAVLTADCRDCKPSCALTSNVAAQMVYNHRVETLKHRLNNGARKSHITNIIMATSSRDTTHYGDANAVRKRKSGAQISKSKVHCVVNGFEVCADFFAEVHGVSGSMVTQACAIVRSKVTDESDAKQSRPEHPLPRGLGTAEEHEVFEPFRTLQTVVWVLNHAQDEGAELLPMAQFHGLQTVEEVLNKARALGLSEDEQDTCQVRLHEHEVSQLHTAYKNDIDNGRIQCELMPIESFRSVFKRHRRLRHIIVARIRDNFSECTECSNQKMALRKTGDPAARGTQARTLQATAKQSPTHLCSTPAITMIERGHHLDLVMAMRHAYAVRSTLPIVDTVNMTVARGLSLVLDKPSSWACQAPAFPGGCTPKSMGARLPNTPMGVIAHGIQSYALFLPPAVEHGVNASIESIHHVLVDIQSKFSETPDKLHIQGDNHTDNKTPAMMVYLAWLVHLGVITEAELHFMKVGHGHIDIDQKFSAWLRRIIARDLRNVTRSRMAAAIRTSQRNPAQQPHTVDLEIRDWQSWAQPLLESVNLERLAVSGKSEEAAYHYKFTRGDNGDVEMTYKKYDVTPEEYPKPYHVNERIQGDVHTGYGVGSVSDLEFNAKTGQWNMHVLCDDLKSYVFSEKPRPIIFSRDDMPTGLPSYLGMKSSFDKEFANIERSISRACNDLSILKDTPGAVDEWQMLFNDYKMRIGRCKQDNGPWFRGNAPPVLRPYTPAPTTALAVPPPTQSQQFQINPVTHSGFTATDRSRAIKAAAADRCRTTVGGIIAVQLLHGTAGLPVTHTSPFLLAEVPVEFDLNDDVACRFFVTCQSSGTGHAGEGAVGGKWQAAGTRVLSKSLLLCGGLSFEAAGLLDDAALNDMSVADLKDELRARGLGLRGSKAVLKERLKTSTAGSAGRQNRVYKGRQLTGASRSRLLTSVARPFLGL